MGMSEPKLLRQHEKLQKLIGKWEGEEKMYPSPWLPEGGVRAGTMRMKSACDKFFILCDYSQKDGRKTVFRGHGVFGYDGSAKNYILHWFDSMGCPCVATGSWRGKRLVFQDESPMGHCRYTYNLKSDDELSFKLEHSEDGETWAKMMMGNYLRK